MPMFLFLYNDGVKYRYTRSRKFAFLWCLWFLLAKKFMHPKFEKFNFPPLVLRRFRRQAQRIKSGGTDPNVFQGDLI